MKFAVGLRGDLRATFVFLDINTFMAHIIDYVGHL